MTPRRRVLLIVLGLVLTLLAGGLAYARPLLLTATGYAAHNACAVRLVVGRPPGSAAEDLPPNPLVPLLRTTVDEEAGTARATLVGLFAQTAHRAEGTGCTLGEDPVEVPAPPPLPDPDPDVAWPEGALVEVVEDPAVEAALDRWFAEDDAQGRVVGTRAVVVVHDGRIVAERYADGFDASTLQLGWSMAKSVTSTMVGRLVEAGQIALEDDHLLQVWADDDRADITVADLLHMASGLEWDETYDLGTAITEMLYLTDDMGAFAASQPLVHEAGTHQQYSSGTTNLLCDVLHDRSGLGAGMAQELVFEPLGMASAVLEPDASGELVCSSYLWATPRDWARFGLWALQDGEWAGQQLLPEDWISWSTEVRGFATTEDPGHAAHWWANTLPDGSLVLPEVPADAFWASGHDGQRVFVVPSADLVVVRMGFTPEIPGDELGFGPLLGELVDLLG